MSQRFKKCHKNWNKTQLWAIVIIDYCNGIHSRRLREKNINELQGLQYTGIHFISYSKNNSLKIIIISFFKCQNSPFYLNLKFWQYLKN